MNAAIALAVMAMLLIVCGLRWFVAEWKLRKSRNDLAVARVQVKISKAECAELIDALELIYDQRSEAVSRGNRTRAVKRKESGVARAKGQTLQGSLKERVRDLMEQDLEPQAIADQLGTTRKSVNARIAEIRRELGDQAQ